MSLAQRFDSAGGNRLAGAVSAVSELILGKEQQVRLAVTCLLAQGHLLIEDIPGVGKTTLAHALARVFGLDFARVQFTADLLPTDILGVSIFEPHEARFEFHPGPIFTQLLLADEVNRASPKTQSALLEAMEERQVTIDGVTRALPEHFFAVATQNPADQLGTFPLPESQLDRFLMRIGLGYPPASAEKMLLSQRSRRAMLEDVLPSLESDGLAHWQAQADAITVSDALLDYILALLAGSRETVLFRQGLSPRAGLALRRAAQAWALLAGRDHVLPEDVQAVLPAVVDHRLATVDREHASAPPSSTLLKQVPLP
ncbi:MAG: AAA family ATPase [Salinisphaeraceae bacterium]|nr:AAA family ATPase [Salinisphaeraceae bacterium]